METLRHQNDVGSPQSPSPEMFSVPGTPSSEFEFEFESCILSPAGLASPSPAGDIIKPSPSPSPADQFFLNGRLLPHDFPVPPPTATSSHRTSFSGKDNINVMNVNNVSNSNNSVNLSRGTSVGSNMSKDSLMSSRSNSTNSRGSMSTCSTCSSARTSSSETFQNNKRNVSGRYQQFGGSSRRWQFITPAPVLGPSRSRRGRRESGGVGPTASPRNKKDDKSGNSHGEGFLQRMLRSFVATCKACHAMEDKENEFDLDGGVLGN